MVDCAAAGRVDKSLVALASEAAMCMVEKQNNVMTKNWPASFMGALLRIDCGLPSRPDRYAVGDRIGRGIDSSREMADIAADKQVLTELGARFGMTFVRKGVDQGD